MDSKMLKNDQGPDSSQNDQNRSSYKPTPFEILARVVVGLAWPVTIIILAIYFVQHGTGLVGDVQDLMKGNQQFELNASPTTGLHMVVVAQAVQSGLAQQVNSQSGGKTPESADVVAIQRTAAQAAIQVSSTAGNRTYLTKVLWVDDHPSNNVGLSYALQALGIVVVCVDSNRGIDDAFTSAGGFDLVITDMYRDPVGNRPAEPEGGLETVKMVQTHGGSIPVIIYAGSYSAAHANDPLSAPVVAVTNDPRVVFDYAVKVASQKNKGFNVNGG
jgi:CheY-like chemotaxis protein